MENIITLDIEWSVVDLIYSPDDGEWHLEKYLHNKHDTTVLTSQTFSNKVQALQAYSKNDVCWD